MRDTVDARAGHSGGSCQVMHTEVDDAVDPGRLVIDLVTLEPFQWVGVDLPLGAMVTMTIGPSGEDEGLQHVAERWSTYGEVIEVASFTDGDDVLVMMQGSDEVVLFSLQ